VKITRRIRRMGEAMKIALVWCSWRLYGDRGSHLLLVEGVFWCEENC
jgi:hypothetical protein